MVSLSLSGLSLFLRFLILDFYMDRFIEALQFHGIFSPSILLLSVYYHIDAMSWLLLLSLQFTDIGKLKLRGVKCFV